MDKWTALMIIGIFTMLGAVRVATVLSEKPASALEHRVEKIERDLTDLKKQCLPK